MGMADRIEPIVEGPAQVRMRRDRPVDPAALPSDAGLEVTYAGSRSQHHAGRGGRLRGRRRRRGRYIDGMASIGKLRTRSNNQHKPSSAYSTHWHRKLPTFDQPYTQRHYTKSHNHPPPNRSSPCLRPTHSSPTASPATSCSPSSRRRTSPSTSISPSLRRR